ncbi:MAG TPA: efflux RND transporter periplasmic adaptor subunit [Candidatus Aquilonibacter sp.]|nr:efflux RND transporter periplasmic adaptor subunit [Candidatus Aquilonibacter sp.]
MVAQTNQRDRGTRWVCAGLASAILVTGWCSGCGGVPKANASSTADVPHVAVVPVKRQNISSTLEIDSELEPFQEIPVYAKVSGYIEKLNIDWGTHVRRGQLLAVLDVPELQQQIEEDKASMNRSDQDVARAQEELKGAESAYKVAHLTYTRLAGVQKTQPDLISQEDIDEAQGKDLQTDAGVSAAKDSLAASQQELAAAKAALDKDTALFDYSNITAPFDGVVTEMDAYTGALLPAGTSSNKGDLPLCHLSQNDLLRLVIPVPERAVPDVPVGRMVSVQVSTTEKSFQGKIARVSDQIDLDTRTMHTEVDVPNPNYTLVPGMYATVEIPLQTQDNVLVVPTQTVQSSAEGQGTVLVVDSDNKIEKRDVTTGIQNAANVQILSGLKENERVLLGEQSQYKSGELVNPEVVNASEVE